MYTDITQASPPLKLRAAREERQPLCECVRSLHGPLIQKPRQAAALSIPTPPRGRCCCQACLTTLCSDLIFAAVLLVLSRVTGGVPMARRAAPVHTQCTHFSPRLPGSGSRSRIHQPQQDMRWI